MENKNKRQVAKITVFITSIFIIFMSVTYAFITQTLTGTKEVVINTGVLDLVLEEENAITISDALPMYDEVGMIQEDVFVFRLVNKTSNPTNYVLKLQEIETGTLDKSIVKYGLIKEGKKKIDFVSNIVDGIIDEGTIAGNDTIDYELRLWIDSEVTSLTQVQSKFLSFRMSADTSQVIAKDPSSAEVKLFASENLGSNCTTYDDGVDTFLVGRCSQNYVWYSGKLWRVVLKNNETGAVKMVTQNGITAIPYNEAENTTFEGSYMDQWLNQEFLPTLHDYEDYLVVDSIWDATADSSYEPERPAGITKSERTVGLLNAYEHYTTYAKSGDLATKDNVYLAKQKSWSLITPYEDGIYMKYVESNNNFSRSYPTGAREVRPSINLKSTIQIDSGSGKVTDPYILKGDLQETIAGTTLLSTRYSGEYIKFNDALYRIVGVETINGEKLTKITAFTNPSSLSDNLFGSGTFASATIKSELETYYQDLKTTNVTAFNMIQPNTSWYLGGLGDNYGTYHYKSTICANIDANSSMNSCIERTTSTTASIALPRIGEMFTSTIDASINFWTLTPWNAYNQWYIIYQGYASTSHHSHSKRVRPSLYLKSNIIITGGNGTRGKPYSIELNSVQS